MSDPTNPAADPAKITTTVEADGSVMMNAADVVDWLRFKAEEYGSGVLGGTPLMRRGAHQALTRTADGIQSAYIDVAADEATRWFGGLA